ncbi:MAG: sigma-70 family RNA polymerase sigma factor [Planctomycetota bacterium]
MREPRPDPGPSVAVAGEDPRGDPAAETLALAAAGGDDAAFATLVARFEGPLYRFLLLRTGRAAEAEELVQEAFVKAWRNLARYDPRWRFSTWLYTLAGRLAISRARLVRPPGEGEEALAGVAVEADPARLAAGREERENLWALAARVLRPEERSALWLRYGEGRDPGEIAQILGRRRVTVRVLLFRARGELARRLGAPRPAPIPSAPAPAARPSPGGRP